MAVKKSEIKERNILFMILMFIITFGLYALYWYMSFQNRLKKATGKGFNGLMHLIATIITLGIYGLYWQYAAGKRLAMLGASDNSVLYLILTILVFPSWLNPFLMQSAANKI